MTVPICAAVHDGWAGPFVVVAAPDLNHCQVAFAGVAGLLMSMLRNNGKVSDENFFR